MTGIYGVASPPATIFAVNAPTISDSVALSTCSGVSLRVRGTLLVILLLGAVLRCGQANEGLWVDELHTSWVVSGSWSEIAWRAEAGNQGPLYFYLVSGVVRLCGHHEWSLRLISLISGTLLIAVAWALTRHWTGSTAAGLLAATLVAVNRDCIFFGQEARPYALVQLSVLVHAALFVSLLQRPTLLKRLGFVLGAGWLFYLHYTTFLFLVAEGICLLVLLPCRRCRITYAFPQAVRDAFYIALLLLPAATHVLMIARHRDNWTRIVAAWPPPRSLQLAAIAYVLVPLAVVGYSYARAARTHGFSLRSPPGIFAGCWAVVPVVIAWITTLGHIAPLYLGRYLVASLVGAMVFAALCVAACYPRPLRWVLASALIATTLLASGFAEQWRRDGRFIGDRDEAWHAAIPWLQEQLRSESLPVFLFAGLLEDLALGQHADDRELVEYCLYPLHGIYRLDAAFMAPLPTTPNAVLTARQGALVAQRHGAWLIVRAGPKLTNRIVNALQQSLRSQGAVADVTQQRRFGGVAMIQLSVD